MIKKEEHGGIILYVLVIWGIIILFLALTLILFASSVSSAKTLKSYIHKNYLRSNIVNNAIERYKNNYADFMIYAKQDDYNHELTRFKNDETVFIDYGFRTAYFWEFQKNQRELAFIDLDTEDYFPNRLDDMRNWKILWNMKTDTSLADVKKYNPIQRLENTDLRITLLKTGSELSKKCFNTSNTDVTGSIASEGAFNSSLTLDESFFKSIVLSDDCTQTDINDTTTLLNTNGAAVLDFDNDSYLLKIEALDGSTHVRLQAVGNSNYIPTNTMNISVVPEAGGAALEKDIFIGASGSLMFSLLDGSERVYNSQSITDPDEVDEDMWLYFMGVIMDKY